MRGKRVFDGRLRRLFVQEFALQAGHAVAQFEAAWGTNMTGKTTVLIALVNRPMFSPLVSELEDQTSRYSKNKVLFTVPCVYARETCFLRCRNMRQEAQGAFLGGPNLTPIL